MKKMTKRMTESLKLVDKTKLYSLNDAVDTIKAMPVAKFDESIELHVRLGVDPRHADQMVRGTVILPHGTGKNVRVAVFTKAEKEKEALDAGAEFVGADELVTKVMGGWADFDVAIATPDMMKDVGKLGKVLGPRGLMPNPKVGTVTNDLAKAIQEAKAGRVEYKVDKAGIVHVSFGKKAFSADQLRDNLRMLMNALIKAKPAAAKGTYMKSVYIASTMGPSVRIDPTTIQTEK